MDIKLKFSHLREGAHYSEWFSNVEKAAPEYPTQIGRTPRDIDQGHQEYQYFGRINHVRPHSSSRDLYLSVNSSFGLSIPGIPLSLPPQARGSKRIAIPYLVHPCLDNPPHLCEYCTASVRRHLADRDFWRKEFNVRKGKCRVSACSTLQAIISLNETRDEKNFRNSTMKM